MFQQGIFLEVEANAQVVEVVADGQHFRLIGNSILATEPKILLAIEDVASTGTVFDNGTDAEIVGRYGRGNVIQLAETATEVLLKFRESSVGGQVHR